MSISKGKGKSKDPDDWGIDDDEDEVARNMWYHEEDHENKKTSAAALLKQVEVGPGDTKMEVDDTQQLKSETTSDYGDDEMVIDDAFLEQMALAEKEALEAMSMTQSRTQTHTRVASATGVTVISMDPDVIEIESDEEKENVKGLSARNARRVQVEAADMSIPRGVKRTHDASKDVRGKGREKRVVVTNPEDVIEISD